MDQEEEFDINEDSEIDDSDNELDDESKQPNISKKIKIKTDNVDDELEEFSDDDAEDDADLEIDSDYDENDSVNEEPNNKVVVEPPIELRNFELSDEEDSDSDDEDYLQKFDESINANIIEKYHPELKSHNYDEIRILTKVVRNDQGEIIDPLHKTLPFITKYEKARVIGERAKQINAGATPMIEIEPSVIDGYLIALREFEEKQTPFIIKRPMPNGGCEYWKLSDLEILV